MDGILKIIKKSHYHVKNNDWDNLIIIDGDVGRGKSNLGLHCIDFHYREILKEYTDDIINLVALSPVEFAKALKLLKRYGMIVYDEAADLSNLRQMNKFNYRLSLAYQVIRGLNLITILVMPNIFRLNPYFVKDRARFFFHVYERDKIAKVAVYDKRLIHKIIDYNENRKNKYVMRVKPWFYDWFKKYSGPLLPEYKKKKIKRMDDIRDELVTNIEQDTANFEMELMQRAIDLIGVQQTAKIWNLTRQGVWYRMKKYKSEVKR